LRRTGLALRCLAHLGGRLLARGVVVSALVNEQNLAGQALVERAGYTFAGYYDTIFLSRNAGAE
jgi:predicted GNAT family acetyltransferase